MVEIWRETLRVLQGQLAPKDYTTWIAPMRPAQLVDGEATLEVPNGFFREWVRRHFIEALSRTIAGVSGRPCRVALVVNRDLTAAPVVEAEPRRSGPRRAEVSRAVAAGPPSIVGRLVPAYTFDAFVVGAANEIATSAARAVAAEPGRRYNPLFLHGGVGLGKTHLLNAIGHAIRERLASCRLVCLTAETFVNEMITALRRDQMDVFRGRFRRVDALIIDDIQFLAGKVRSQEEFFHTFNALHDGRKQIIVASDKPPQEIRDLEDCLRSRFTCGLLATIDTPDEALRGAILARKAAEMGIALAPDLQALIAGSRSGNVRELEGVLNALRAHASLRGETITPALVRDILGLGGPCRDPAQLAAAIVEAVAGEFAVSVAELRSPRRTARLAEARQAAILLCREHTDLSLGAIGRHVGGRDHSTVFHALGRAAERRRERADFEALVARVSERLTAP